MTNGPRLTAEKRIVRGTAACRRLRRRGVVPGNVYGHGMDPVAIAIEADTLKPLVQSGAQVVDVEIEGKSEKTIIREVQWDTLSVNIQHVDLLRVDPNERVTVDVPIELRGVAPGVAAGGHLEQNVHSLTIDCLAIKIPERIWVRIGSLEIDQSIPVKDLELPEGTNVHNPPEMAVVRVAPPIDIEEPTEVEEVEAAEPELVGKKAKEESDEEQ